MMSYNAFDLRQVVHEGSVLPLHVPCDLLARKYLDFFSWPGRIAIYRCESSDFICICYSVAL